MLVLQMFVKSLEYRENALGYGGKLLKLMDLRVS